jgi:hypothetical protein
VHKIRKQKKEKAKLKGYKLIMIKITETTWPESASELYPPSDRRLSAKIVPTFDDGECCVVSAMNPHSHILGSNNNNNNNNNNSISRSGDTGSIPGITRKKRVVGLERGPLSLVRITGDT